MHLLATCSRAITNRGISIRHFSFFLHWGYCGFLNALYTIKLITPFFELLSDHFNGWDVDLRCRNA